MLSFGSSLAGTKEFGEDLNYVNKSIHRTQVNESLILGPERNGGFSVLDGTLDRDLVFDGEGGTVLNNGAIKIQDDGKLLIIGTVKFIGIANADYRGAIDIEPGGTLHIELLQAGDELIFRNTLADYDIRNGGDLVIRIGRGTKIKFSDKGIHSGEDDGTLKIFGPGEVNIGPSVIQEGSIEFIGNPIITLSIEEFDRNIEATRPSHRRGAGAVIFASVVNTDRNIWGDLYINPKIPAGHYDAGTKEEHMYIYAGNGAGEGREYRPELLPYMGSDYGYSIAFRGGDVEDTYNVYARDTLEFTFKKDTDVISGLQRKKLVVEEGKILTSKGSLEPVHLKFLEKGAIEIRDNGEAYIVGSAVFSVIKNDGRGVIDLKDKEGMLSILLPMANDSVRFIKTGGNTVDIHHADS
ncbi:MAG: hypothetical protein LBI29_01095, partial [Rickettsiales bacterium]|nr:hypothetical protein [Rickettsiales bacterium]